MPGLSHEGYTEITKIFDSIQKTSFSEAERVMMEIGSKVKEARKRKGWTQADLAEKAEVEEMVIIRIETMEAQRSAIIEVLRVCKVLDITVTVN